VAPANSFYLLWMILGYLVVTSVLVVSLGRLGDIRGRVKMYAGADELESLVADDLWPLATYQEMLSSCRRRRTASLSSRLVRHTSAGVAQAVGNAVDREQ
jgi:hypothetical protein